MGQPSQRLGEYLASLQTLWSSVLGGGVLMESQWKLCWTALATLPAQEEPHRHTLHVTSRLSCPLSSFASEMMVSYFCKNVDPEIPIVECKAEEYHKVSKSGACQGHSFNGRKERKNPASGAATKKIPFWSIKPSFSSLCECLTSCTVSEYKLCPAHSG